MIDVTVRITATSGAVRIISGNFECYYLYKMVHNRVRILTLDNEITEYA